MYSRRLAVLVMGIMEGNNVQQVMVTFVTHVC